jgi:hypothetical protein
MVVLGGSLWLHLNHGNRRGRARSITRSIWVPLPARVRANVLTNRRPRSVLVRTSRRGACTSVASTLLRWSFVVGQPAAAGEPAAGDHLFAGCDAVGPGRPSGTIRRGGRRRRGSRTPPTVGARRARLRRRCRGGPSGTSSGAERWYGPAAYLDDERAAPASTPPDRRPGLRPPPPGDDRGRGSGRVLMRHGHTR